MSFKDIAFTALIVLAVMFLVYRVSAIKTIVVGS